MQPPTKTLAMLFRRRELAAKNFDGDQPVQRDVARKEYNAHSAPTELTHDLELGTEMLNDLLALPFGAHRRELAGNR